LSRTAKIALCAASLAMKERLQRLLTHREPYFILTGSDPADLNGCCPNDLVGEANRLTAAGVLARHPVPTGPDACTNTLFAFAGEITGTPDLPRFCIEEARRQQVAELLSETAAAAATQPLRTGLRIFLALLALASLSLAVHRTAQLAGACSGPEDMTGALTRVLHVSPRATVLIVCLFTGDRHCDNCGQLRSRGQAVLQRWFPEELATGLIQWREINLDAPVNRPLRPHVSGGATTLGLVRVSAGIPREVRLLTRQLWHLRDNEAAVAAMLRDEISQLLADRS
jgi:hypothetical protein